MKRGLLRLLIINYQALCQTELFFYKNSYFKWFYPINSKNDSF